MQAQDHDWSWLDASETIDAPELSRICGLAIGELDDLVGYGALQPLEGTHPPRFSAACVSPLRHACRLRRDFDLDLFTVALLVDYLNRIEELEHELRLLHAHLPKHVVAVDHREGPQPWREPHGKA